MNAKTEVEAMDRADSLAQKRDEFDLPDNVIYLNGNSLGPLPRRAKQRIKQIVEQEWGQDLIASWNSHNWIDLPSTSGEKIARLIGSAPGQVLCCDSISVNLFKLLAVCLQLQTDRCVILSQKDNFPTDLYVAQGIESLLGAPRCQLKMVDENSLEASLTEEVAVLFLTQVNFRDGRLHDIQALTQKAHDSGILVVWDLAHSTGVLPLELDAWEVDFALGCGYKFLNGGPGAPAFVYANKKHHNSFQQPLQGWMGHKAAFDFDVDYQPAPGIAQFLSGTPSILSLGALDAALDVFDDVDIGDLQQKSMALTELFLRLVEADHELDDLHLESPQDSTQRGAQLAFSHPHAYAICRAINADGLVADYRNSDLLRFGFSPMILSYADIMHSVEILSKVVAEEKYKDAKFNKRLRVT